MARIRMHGLRRSVGVPGLFATAYGNVGSSIYYALGLVAAHALGLTPLVFMLAGGLFALTARTYAEGASMFPEAGGSSSFARHAFNEVASFFAGWALSLDYACHDGSIRGRNPTTRSSETARQALVKIARGRVEISLSGL